MMEKDLALLKEMAKTRSRKCREELKNERKMKSRTQWVDCKELKEKIDMEEILEHYGLLKELERREDELVGFCPIHGEKHYNENAFYVNTSKGNWHCFSCGAGGNVLAFVVAIENVNIREAGLLFQKWFGITSEQKRQLTKEKRKEEVKEERHEEVVNPPLRGSTIHL